MWLDNLLPIFFFLRKTLKIITKICSRFFPAFIYSIGKMLFIKKSYIIYLPKAWRIFNVKLRFLKIEATFPTFVYSVPLISSYVKKFTYFLQFLIRPKEATDGWLAVCIRVTQGRPIMWVYFILTKSCLKTTNRQTAERTDLPFITDSHIAYWYQGGIAATLWLSFALKSLQLLLNYFFLFSTFPLHVCFRSLLFTLLTTFNRNLTVSVFVIWILTS